MYDQNQTPLLDTLRACAKNPHASFYTPGHKRGVGISSNLADTFGKMLFQHDLPELTELDNLFAPNGVILQAQQLAADAFGASQSWFLVNGSTCGIEAAILATCGAGDKIILPRNVHSSAIAGLIFSGAMPIFINPEYDPVLDIAHSFTPQALSIALRQHPDAKAVMMVYPTYYGVCGDIEAIAEITHEYNIPLLVDEAHGAHFGFHPEFPMTGLKAGADLTVQSIHKTLGAMTQASMLHLQGDRVDADRVNKALQLVQSTSPSYILLASLDAARQQMALYGKELMSRTLELADDARNRISQILGLSVLKLRDLTPPTPPSLAGKGGTAGNNEFGLDRTRLTVTVSGLGLTGFAAEEILDEKLGVTPEFASLQHVTFIISIGNTQEDIDFLVQAFTTLAEIYPPSNQLMKKEKEKEMVLCKFENSMAISPREAFFAPTKTLPLRDTVGCICAEIVCPYPPGIPVLMPGEVVTDVALNYLLQVKAMGGFITGCGDSSLESLKVVMVKDSKQM
jgi:arginine decarboxylase